MCRIFVLQLCVSVKLMRLCLTGLEPEVTSYVTDHLVRFLKPGKLFATLRFLISSGS